jgi:hypothetical protein
MRCRNLPAEDMGYAMDVRVSSPIGQVTPVVLSEALKRIRKLNHPDILKDMG